MSSCFLLHTSRDTVHCSVGLQQDIRSYGRICEERISGAMWQTVWFIIVHSGTEQPWPSLTESFLCSISDIIKYVVRQFNEVRTSCENNPKEPRPPWGRTPKEAFAAAMQSWRERREKCVCLQGDYIEKWLHFQLPVVSSFFKIN